MAYSLTVYCTACLGCLTPDRSVRSRGKVGSAVYIAIWPVYYALSASGRILARVLTRGIRVRVLEGMGAREQIVEGAPLDSRV